MKTRWKIVIGFIVLVAAGAGWTAHQAYKAYTDLTFFAAAFNGQTDVVEKLLRHGENVDAKDAKYGGTALIYAAQEGHTDIVKLLLDKGANIEATTRLGQTALFQAAYKGNYDTVKLLLARGATLDEKHKASLLAAEPQFPAIAELLQAAPTKPSGKTP